MEFTELGWEVDRAGSGSCPMAGSDISGVELQGSTRQRETDSKVCL